MKSLQEIADTAAEAARRHLEDNANGRRVLYLLSTMGTPCDSRAILAFAQSVVEQMSEMNGSSLMPPPVKTSWVKCPICGGAQMRKEEDSEGNVLILCVNHECGSNGGSNFSSLPAQEPVNTPQPPDAPPLVTFDADGKINPPPHGQWHRSDFTPEMLEGGWRPLLDGEAIASGIDEIDYSDFPGGLGWRKCQNLPKDAAGKESQRRRTRRPLPAPPKEPEWVPLGPEDGLLGCWIRCPSPDSYPRIRVVSDIRRDRVVLYDFRHGESDTTFQNLMDKGYEFLRPGQTWQKCRKLKPEGAVKKSCPGEDQG